MLFYDVVIIGGGLVGTGLAAALRQSDLRIALVDARMPQSDDPRLFALNAGSCDFLDNVNVWSTIQAFAAPIKEVHVSSRGHFGATHLKHTDADLASLGHVIPAHHLESALNDLMVNSSTCDIYRPATLQAMTQDDDGVTVTLTTSNGDITLCGALVVGADGADSTVRKLAGINTENVDYQQTALVTRTSLSRAHSHIAYERFTKQGTIAMLPLVGNECATIWSGERAHIEKLLALDDSAFLSALQIQFGYRLGRLHAVAKRHHYPLRMMRAETMTKGNIFLIGNAAHTLHPVAAQGFNLAMYEAAVLVDALITAKANNTRFSASLLQAVYADIKKQQATSTTFSHRLADCLTDSSSLIGKLLPIGLAGLDLVTPLRRRFVRKIMGRTGRVPRLLMSANK